MKFQSITKARSIIFLLILTSSSCHHEKPIKMPTEINVVQEKTYFNLNNRSENLQSMARVGDDNLVLAGWTSGPNDIDIYVVKLNNLLEEVWSVVLGGSLNDNVTTIIPTEDGGYVLCANTYSNDRQVLMNHGNSDIWVVKLDQNGALQWSKTFGGSGDDGVYSNCIVATASGGFVVCGYTESTDGDVITSKGQADIWMLELDAQGNLVKQASIGTAGNDFSFGIRQTIDDQFVILARIDYSDETFDKPGIWVIKTSIEGEASWRHYIIGENPGNIKLTQDGGYVVVYSEFANEGDLAVEKINKAGQSQWKNKFPFSTQEVPVDIIELDRGGFLMLANSNLAFVQEMLLIRVDKNGNKLYEKEYGSPDVSANSLVKLNNNKIIAGGSKYVSDNEFLVVEFEEK
jgi:hypothetical protein